MTDVDGIDLSPAFARRSAAAARAVRRVVRAARGVRLGAARERSGRARGSSSRRRSPSCSTSRRTPASRPTSRPRSRTVARDLDARANRYSPPRLPATRVIDASGLERLRALGYATGSRLDNEPAGRRSEGSARRRGPNRAGDLGRTVRPRAQDGAGGDSRRRRSQRPGARASRFLLAQSGDCQRAEQEFAAAINGGLPTADAHIGLATCLGRRNDLAGAPGCSARFNRCVRMYARFFESERAIPFFPEPCI